MNKNFKKIAFGDSLKMRFSVVSPSTSLRTNGESFDFAQDGSPKDGELVEPRSRTIRKVLYTFLHHKVFIFFFILCLLPLKLPAADPSPFEDSNVTISMDFQDANLKDVVKIFSIQSGLNFIASEAVQDRKITLFLDKVPIKEVMDKLFKANNLTYELDEEAKIFIVKDWGKPEIETITKVYYLKYRSVPSARLAREKSDLLSKTTGAATTGAATTESSGNIITSIQQLLSQNGKIAEDISTNSLIVTDIPNRFPNIDRVIASLDIPQPQIMLEVEMLDVSKNVVDSLGFNWSDAASYALQVASASKLTSWPLASFAPQGGISGTKFNAGTVSFPTNLKLVFDFLRTRTDTKYLARPRLLTLNNESAEIYITKDEVVGREDTVTTGTSTTTTSVFKRSTELKLTPEGTGIFLRVTPQINPDTNEIIMVINPKSSSTSTSPLSITTATSTQGVNLQSDVEIRATKSIVKVRDGETIVLGGIIHQDKNIVVRKLPILGDIPMLGALFRSKNQTKGLERELLVFITPHIVKDTKTEFAQAKKTSLLTKEQITVSPSGRQLAIETSLSSFEKVK